MSRLSDEMIEELDNLVDSLTPSERGDYEAYLDRDHPGGTPDMNSQIKYIRSIKGRRMMDGGEVVPKKYKGFSKLPEKVQTKIDPELARKYKNGGAVMAGRGGKFKGVK
jgi:hypothetical protein